MAILRDQEGKFFEVPDEVLAKYEMPEAKLKAIGGGATPVRETTREGQPQNELNLPACGGGPITINLNLGGQAPRDQGAQQGQQGDVQGHGWAIYHNRYWAYRNQYWAYRNHY